MKPLDPATATQYVIWGGLLLGLFLGVVGQISRFCTRGAIADWVTFRGPARAVSWLLAVAVAAVLVQALISGKLFDPTRAVSWGTSLLWLSCVAGGLVFGYGMILAGGCLQRCLVKTGSGDLKALVVLIVTAIAALMTLRGAFAVLRVDFLDKWRIQLGTPQDLGSLTASALPVSADVVRWVLAVGMLAFAAWLAWRNRAVLERSHWIGGILVGLLVPLAFYLTGHIGFIAEHPETLEPAWMGTQSRRPEALSFSAPLAHALDLLTLWSDKATVATFGVMLSLGVLVGAFASAKSRKDFRPESFQTPKDLLAHMAGSVMMGVGGVTALGCSVGNGVTGVAMLSAGAILATAGIVAGAVLALKAQQMQMERAEMEPGLKQAGA